MSLIWVDPPRDPGLCERCFGEPKFLGELGIFDWYRCQSCGHEWAIESGREEEQDDERRN